MMTAEEYRAKAVEAQTRSDATEAPHLKEAFSLHALKWESLAMTADIQAQLEINTARDVE